MDLYGQEPEARLLTAFLTRLERREVIDVGAERGAFTDEMLRAGSDDVHVIEPDPANAAFLRDHFRDDCRVTVHECAVTDRDGEFELHTSVDVDGRPVSFGHTLLDRAGTEEIAWSGSVSVIGRSLASLVNGGELPKQVGILKIDTEGSDLAVVTGMGPLECDVVMVEHWTYLPNSLGRCPWTIEEMHSALRPRGFSHFALIAHEQPFVILKWDDAELPVGHMGNLVFLHDKVLDQLLPEIVSCASSLAEDAVRTGQMYVDEAGKRLVVIEELERACQAYAERIDELERNLIHRLVKATRRSRSH